MGDGRIVGGDELLDLLRLGLVEAARVAELRQLLLKHDVPQRCPLLGPVATKRVAGHRHVRHVGFHVVEEDEPGLGTGGDEVQRARAHVLALEADSLEVVEALVQPGRPAHERVRAEARRAPALLPEALRQRDGAGR